MGFDMQQIAKLGVASALVSSVPAPADIEIDGVPLYVHKIKAVLPPTADHPYWTFIMIDEVGIERALVVANTPVKITFDPKSSPTTEEDEETEDDDE